jgi:hypothetical protein
MHTLSFNQSGSRTSSRDRSPIFGWYLRLPDINWYQVVVVAVTTFALAMDLMFPPSRIALGNGFAVYAGHFFAPLSAPAAIQVDFGWLAIELLAIVAMAVIGWKLDPAERAESDRDGEAPEHRARLATDHEG